MVVVVAWEGPAAVTAVGALARVRRLVVVLVVVATATAVVTAIVVAAMVDVRVVATATVVVPVAVSAGSAVQWVLDVALVALVAPLARAAPRFAHAGRQTGIGDRIHNCRQELALGSWTFLSGPTPWPAPARSSPE